MSAFSGDQFPEREVKKKDHEVGGSYDRELFELDTNKFATDELSR